jgi:hypothetical protein
MFVLKRDEFGVVDRRRIAPFVKCWERYYRGAEKGFQEYLSQLNLGRDLTNDNIKRLLRWKDARWLTHPMKHNGGPNPRVARVLRQRASINAFRKGRLSAKEFTRIVKKIFPSGLIDLPPIFVPR